MNFAHLWELTKTGDVITLIILLGLVSSYFLCFAIIVYKWLFFYAEKKRVMRIAHHIKNARSVADILALQKQIGLRDSIAYDLIAESIQTFQMLSPGTHAARSAMTMHEQEFLMQSLDAAADHITQNYERGLPILGTAAAVSPLVGLFGTIWGLIHAFVNIGQAKSADLSIIAPGIAEALLTTLAGLIVAIPALVFFHYFAHIMRLMDYQLRAMSDHIVLVYSKGREAEATLSFEPNPRVQPAAVNEPTTLS